MASKFHTRYWFATDWGGSQAAYDAAKVYFKQLVAQRSEALRSETIGALIDPSPTRPPLSTGVIFLLPTIIPRKPDHRQDLAWSVRDQSRSSAPEKSRILPGGKIGAWTGFFPG